MIRPRIARNLASTKVKHLNFPKAREKCSAARNTDRNASHRPRRLMALTTVSEEACHKKKKEEKKKNKEPGGQGNNNNKGGIVKAGIVRNGERHE